MWIPQEFASREAPASREAAGDEIGEVAAAFGEMHRTALATAAEQALERSSLGAMLVVLARRGDGLLTRLIRLLTDEERGEQTRSGWTSCSDLIMSPR
jgi:hypothetical protein